MPRKLDARQTTIPIIQVVDVVHLVDDATLGAIEAAFGAAGRYIQDRVGGPEDIILEFAWEGLEFTASHKGTGRNSSEGEMA